jgi:NAD(P)-dependent dehydrogenase (short-subunit alcohol dehydrogenase family)
VGCGRTPTHVEAIKAQHPDWDVSLHDLSHKEEAKAFASYIRDHYPTLDILVNNAGYFAPSSLLTEPPDLYEYLLSVNLHSAYYVTKDILPVFLQRRSGLIINIASVASISAYPKGASYAIAKAALLALGRNLREELKPHGIAVTNILLGATLTDSWEGAPYPPERFIPPTAVADLLWSIAHLPRSAVVEELLLRPFWGDL